MKTFVSFSVSGIKSNYETSGVDNYVRLNDCKASLNESHHVESILKWAQDANMATGFVTTTRYVQIKIIGQIFSENIENMCEDNYKQQQIYFNSF